MSRVARPPRATTQFDNWCFTAYHINEDGVVVQLHADADGKGFSDVSTIPFGPLVKRAQWQLEKCPHTGRIHIQGVVRMAKRMVFSSVKAELEKYFSQTIHLEGCGGTWEENLVYTSKPESRIAGPYRHNVRDPDAPFQRVVEYWHGPPGTGKSTTARRFLSERGFDIYEVAKSQASKGTWLPGFSGQESVIMDEVDYKWFDDSGWKKILDRMPQTLVAGAGGKNVVWDPVYIILISNHPPTKFLSCDAIKSRIHHVVEFNKPLITHTAPDVQKAADRFAFLK